MVSLSMVSLLPTLFLLLAPTVNGFSTKIPRFSSAVAAARHTPVVSLVGATFDPLEAYEKVALTRAVRNATYASQIASNATAAWVVIKADFAPDLDKLSDDTLNACYNELMTVDATPIAPTPSEGGLSVGAVPVAFLAAAVIFGLVGSGGDVLCDSGADAPTLNRACAEQATRK